MIAWKRSKKAIMVMVLSLLMGFLLVVGGLLGTSIVVQAADTIIEWGDSELTQLNNMNYHSGKTVNGITMSIGGADGNKVDNAGKNWVCSDYYIFQASGSTPIAKIEVHCTSNTATFYANSFGNMSIYYASEFEATDTVISVEKGFYDEIRFKGNVTGITKVVFYLGCLVKDVTVTSTKGESPSVTCGGDAIDVKANVAVAGQAGTDDRKVSWTVSEGSDLVKLYEDETCQTPISETGSYNHNTNIYVKPLAAGTVKVRATSVLNNNVYGERQITINKGDQTVTPPVANTLTYNGSAQELVTAGTTDGGTMQYALGTDSNTAPTTGWDASIPKGTEAGTYYVWYKAVGDANHNDFAPAYVTAEIKSQFVVTFKVVNGKWNDGTSADRTVTLTGGAGEALKLTADQIPEVGNKPGSAYKVGSWDTAPNTETAITNDTTYTYTYGDSVTDKSQQVIEAEDVSVTYGETDKKVTATVTTPSSGGGAISYTVKDGSGDYIDVDASTGLLTVKAVPADGKAYVTAKAAETDTYAEATKDVTITIAQAPVTPKVELNKTALSLTVNEESTLTATTVPESQQVTWTSSDAAIAAVDTTGKVTAKAAGTAKVTATITVEGQEYKAECDVTVTAPAPTPVSSETIVVPEALSDDSLSPEIVERYGSAEQVTVILQETMGVTPESRGNSSVFDAQVMVIVDGQARPATPADITPEGLEAVFPYPDGTNKDNFIFSGAHMIGETVGGYQAGDIEGLSFTNADDGLHTRIHGLSPVIITWTAAAPGEAPQVDSHVHVYEWDTINATADQDGEMRYQCRICGDIQTRVPITAYYIFNKETTDKIRRAKQGETVKIETARWISFHKMVMEALADRPDVTLEVSFLDEGHKGTRKNFTIPAGTDTKSLVDDKGFAGFIYLTNKFGN